MKALRDDRKTETTTDIEKRITDLTPEEKYAVGLQIIMKIGEHVETLKKDQAFINQQWVCRSDLSHQRENPNYQHACEYYLTSLGFWFVNGPSGITMEGDIGYLVRTNTKNAKQLCTIFINKLAPGNSIHKWTSALYNGFVIDKKNRPNMTEINRVQPIVKKAVDGIWSCVQDFQNLKIEVED